MDPISAVGVAACIVQFVALGGRVATRLKEYNSTIIDVPKSLQGISVQIPLIINALDRIKTDISTSKLDVNTRCILRGVVAGCMQQVEKIEKIIDRVQYTPGDSLVHKVQKVFMSLKNDEKVVAIEKNLQTYISVLVLHSVIEGPDASLTAIEEASYFEVRVMKVAPFFERGVLMQQIEKTLQPVATSQAHKPVMVALVGPEGAGKTQLAIEYCHQAKSTGQFQTIFWMNAATSENLFRSLESASDIIRRSKEGLKNRDEKIDFVKSFLRDRWHPWLLVLDDYDPGSNDIMNYLPSIGSGAVLFTTKHVKFSYFTHLIQVPKFRHPDELKRLQNSLVLAVRYNEVKKVNSLLADGADPDTRNESGWPCLHYAIDENYEAIARLLLARGASSRAQVKPGTDFDGYSTALYYAASNGNISMTRLLLDHEDTRKTAPTNNNAVLRVAASKGYGEIVCIMLQHGSADLTSANRDNETALGLAVKGGYRGMVEMLLKAGADANVSPETPLAWAAMKNDLGMVKLLCEQGNAKVNSGTFTNSYDNAPLWHAVRGREEWSEMVSYLLESGADPNYSNPEEKSPLQEAAVRGFDNAVSMLLEHGADAYPSKCYGDPPICTTAAHGRVKAVSLLLQATGADPEICARQREQALHLASREGERKVILHLLEAGVNINTQDDDGKTPLLIAITNQQIPTARFLLRRSALQEIADKHGNTALFLAAAEGFHLVVRDILHSGGRPNLPNANGDTALCLAATYGHNSVVEVLLEYRANPDLANAFGDTPLDLALENDHNSVVEILKAPRPGSRTRAYD